MGNDASPAPDMTAMTAIINPLAPSKEILLYYLTNNGQHFQQKRNFTDDDNDPRFTPMQPPGPLASPSQFSSCVYENQVEVYGMVAAPSAAKSSCGCGDGCGCGGGAAAATAGPITYQPYVISPAYRPVLKDKDEITGTPYFGLAACGDGKKKGWVYISELDQDTNLPGISEIPLHWEGATAAAGGITIVQANSLLAASYVPGVSTNTRWLFYIGKDSKNRKAHDHYVWYYIGDNNAEGAYINASSSVAADSPLASCVIQKGTKPEDQEIHVFFVGTGNELRHVKNVMSDPHTWVEVDLGGDPPLVATGGAQISAIATEDKIRVYYHADGEENTQGWNWLSLDA